MTNLINIKAKELISDTIEIALRNLQASIHTQTIAKVVAVNSTTIDVKPVINRVVNEVSIELPTFIKVPPIFLSGGGSSVTMPLAVGDYCLLFFTERCFDMWYEGTDFVNPLELRMHDYSDGFALVGIMTASNALNIPDEITISGNSTQTGDYTLNGNQIINGNLTVNGTIFADRVECVGLFIAGNDYSLHTHTQNNDSAGNIEQDTGVPIT